MSTIQVVIKSPANRNYKVELDQAVGGYLADSSAGYRHVSIGQQGHYRVSFSDLNERSDNSWITYESPAWNAKIAASAAGCLVNSGTIQRFRGRFRKMRDTRIMVMACVHGEYTLWSLKGAYACHVPTKSNKLTKKACLDQYAKFASHYDMFLDSEQSAAEVAKTESVLG